MPQRLPALALLCLLAFAFGSSAEARMIVELHGVDGPKYINTQPEIGVRKVRRVKAKHVKARHVRRAAVPIEHRTMFAMPLPRGSVSLNGVVAPLAEKAREIVVTCGARVISAVRRTYVAGTRLVSLHASGRAVDIAGNPNCIRRALAGWQGGASVDYYRVRPPHFHVSWGGREHGKRFVHGGKRKARRTRVARVR